MLRFRQKKIIAVFVLLSLSLNSFADTGLKEKTSINLVELFKVKTHATDHIKGIEAKLLVTNEVDQEELLVELAQSLLYYQDRHNKESDSKVVALNEGRSLSENGTSGIVSKVVPAKGPFSTNKIYHKALNAYKKAAKLSLNKSRIKYTRELSELAVKLQRKDELVQIFDEFLQHGGDESGTYLAHVDYADGLAKFKDDEAEAQFLFAVNMRTPVDGVEANYRYANYLLDNNQLREALIILNKFTFKDRIIYAHIALLRQKIIHLLKMDTKEVDSEVKELRRNLNNSAFISIEPKFIKKEQYIQSNILELPIAHAFSYAHNNEDDDTRGPSGNSWVTWSAPNGAYISFVILHHFPASVVNSAEVVYNESRGAKGISRQAIGWSIRNRATINMNGCDFYPGSESDFKVEVCRKLTPNGPKLEYSDTFKRYSCVVHGGTTSVGDSHSQMNDTHVDINNLVSSGILWEMRSIIYGWISDPTGTHLLSVFPEKDLSTGNPSGAQEWTHQNYCADNNLCKIRLGNIGGNVADPGNFCPDNGGISTDVYLWGRRYGYDLSD